MPSFHSLGLTTACPLSQLLAHICSPCLRVEPSLAHSYSSQGPGEILFSLQWYLMDVCAGVEFFQAFSLVLDSVGLTEVESIHSQRERGPTWLVQSLQHADDKSLFQSGDVVACDQLPDRLAGSRPQAQTRDLCLLPSAVPPLAIPPL